MQRGDLVASGPQGFHIGQKWQDSQDEFQAQDVRRAPLQLNGPMVGACVEGRILDDPYVITFRPAVVACVRSVWCLPCKELSRSDADSTSTRDPDYYGDVF
jgi:hypothetical protein